MTRLRHGESPPGGEGVAGPVRVARKVFDLALVRDAIKIMSCFFEIKKKTLKSPFRPAACVDRLPFDRLPAENSSQNEPLGDTCPCVVGSQPGPCAVNVRFWAGGSIVYRSSSLLPLHAGSAAVVRPLAVDSGRRVAARVALLRILPR